MTRNYDVFLPITHDDVLGRAGVGVTYDNMLGGRGGVERVSDRCLLTDTLSNVWT